MKDDDMTKADATAIVRELKGQLNDINECTGFGTAANSRMMNIQVSHITVLPNWNHKDLLNITNPFKIQARKTS
jgi:hypothetical protein